MPLYPPVLSQTFDVRVYGGGPGIADSTPGIQLAINACFAAGGGTIFFANGIYAINGALQSVSTYNSQLTIPQNFVSGSNPPIAIAFVGEGPAAQNNHGTSGAWLPSTSGAILLSNWAGSIVNHPAVIAASAWDSIYGGTDSASFNWVEVTFQNIEVRAPANPKLSGIQMFGTASLTLEGVTVSTNIDSASMVLPSNVNAVGITGPGISNANPPYLFNNVTVDGFYTGVLLAECTHAPDLLLQHCTIGISLVGPQNHAAHFGRVLFVAVQTGIKITGGLFYFDIDQLDIEHSVGSGTFQRLYDVDDASNYGRGLITSHTVKAGVGPDDDLSVNGGASIRFASLTTGLVKHGLASGVVNLTAGDYSLVQSTFTDVDTTNAAITLTTGARRCLVTVMATGALSGLAQACLDLTIDGVRQGQAYGLVAAQNTSTWAMVMPFSYLTPVLAAGSHVFRLQYRVTNGGITLTLFASTGVAPLQMAVMEQAA